MTGLLATLPDFDLQPYSHILPSLEKALVSISDLLTLEILDVAKRAQVPAGEVKKLAEAVIDGLRGGSESSSLRAGGGSKGRADGEVKEGIADPRWPWAISTLNETLDEALNGGIHAGYLTEITGESAAGKTQFLLTLLLSAQLQIVDGQPKSALYISTEAPLQTTRLTQLLTHHPRLANLAGTDAPSLSRIQSTHTHDLEAQEHILRYQVPVLITRHNVGLVVVDSIAANYRAEFDKGSAGKAAQSLSKRSAQIAQLGTLLRGIAKDFNVAVVVANQVADRFEPAAQIVSVSQSTQRSRPGSPSSNANASTAPFSSAQPANPSTQPQSTLPSTTDPLALDHQQRFFTGWGDDANTTNMKTPSLGLTWTNQLATRIALLREPVFEERHYKPGEDRNVSEWRRTMKVVFSAWCAAGETGYEIWQGGVRSIASKTDTQANES
ncbi:DNA repair protein rhp57 [Oleoguttula sp. CCFEE 5521]